MRYFFDNCMSIRLAYALQNLEGESGVQIVHLRKKFEAKETDSNWLAELGKEGNWIVLSGDWQITRRPHQRQALLSSGLTVFFMVDHYENHDVWEQSWRLVRWWPELCKMAHANPTRSAFKVHWSGNFKCNRI